MSERDPHDAHVVQATKLFRSCGFTLAALQYPRSVEALCALKHFNGVPLETPHPYGWNYFPNAFCRDNWRAIYE